MMTVNETSTLEDQIAKIAALIPQGYRLVTMTSVDCGEHFDIYYHFDRNYELHNLKLELPKGTDLPSISSVCPCAFVIENEMQDLFGITITGMELDFCKHFILNEEAPEKPFCRVPGVSVSTVEVKGEQK
jgi:ech hydrogenase subunit D